MPIDPIISISRIYEQFTEPENTIKIEKNLVFDTDIRCQFSITQDHLQPIMGNLGEILYIREHLMRLCDISGIFEQEIYSQLINFTIMSMNYFHNVLIKKMLEKLNKKFILEIMNNLQ